MDATRAGDVRYAALLHDVGKVAVPSEILLKPGPLTDAEWVTMRSHAATGGSLVQRIPAFAHLAPAVRASHERWDGAGYPDGLAGERIPLAARIIAACDTYEAIVTDRPYRPARTPREAARGAAPRRRHAARRARRRRAARARRRSPSSPLDRLVVCASVCSLFRRGCSARPPRAVLRRAAGHSDAVTWRQ